VETADQVAAWIVARLTWLPSTAEALATVPVLVVVTLVALIIAVRQITPRLGALAVGWLVPAIGFAVTVVLLTVEFAATQPFRWLNLHPPALLYGFGNGAVGVDGSIRDSCYSIVRQIGRLRRAWGWLLLTAAIYAVYRWGAHYCDRHPSSGCTPPIDAWLTSVRAFVDQLGR
jgi:hypothetical protein